LRHDNGYDGRGCNNGKCVPECSYYPGYGRIEDEEVIHRHKEIMTNWHDCSLMIVKSADPTIDEGASLKKMLNELEALLANGYKLKSTTECNGKIFAFLLNESELTRRLESRTTATTTTIKEHESEE
jgi:hypothetical protein